MKFIAKITEKGGLQFDSNFQRNFFHDWTNKNVGKRVEIVPILPESGKQRRWFEGAVVPLITYYQEGYDHHATEDKRMVREWLKVEFNGDFMDIKGIVHKVAKSTKNKLNEGFLERVLEWIQENYAPPAEALSPAKYKHWRDVVFPSGEGHDNYIDYLIELKILTQKPKTS